MVGLWTHLFDPLTLAAMLASIAAVALFQNGGRALARACTAFGPLLTADPAKDPTPPGPPCSRSIRWRSCAVWPAPIG